MAGQRAAAGRPADDGDEAMSGGSGVGSSSVTTCSEPVSMTSILANYPHERVGQAREVSATTHPPSTHHRQICAPPTANGLTLRATHRAPRTCINPLRPPARSVIRPIAWLPALPPSTLVATGTLTGLATAYRDAPVVGRWWACARRHRRSRSHHRTTVERNGVLRQTPLPAVFWIAAIERKCYGTFTPSRLHSRLSGVWR